MKKRLRTVKYTEYIKPPTNKKGFYIIIKRINKKESMYYFIFVIWNCIYTIVYNKRTNELLPTAQVGIKTTNKCILLVEVGQVIKI